MCIYIYVCAYVCAVVFNFRGVFFKRSKMLPLFGSSRTEFLATKTALSPGVSLFSRHNFAPQYHDSPTHI